jgi:hypothetical protein
MKFYEIDEALQGAITAGDKPVRVQIQIELLWGFESIFEQDILEVDFYGLKEAAGGTSARGRCYLITPMGFIHMHRLVHCHRVVKTMPRLPVKISLIISTGGTSWKAGLYVPCYRHNVQIRFRYCTAGRCRYTSTVPHKKVTGRALRDSRLLPYTMMFPVSGSP